MLRAAARAQGRLAYHARHRARLLYPRLSSISSLEVELVTAEAPGKQNKHHHHVFEHTRGSGSVVVPVVVVHVAGQQVVPGAEGGGGGGGGTGGGGERGGSSRDYNGKKEPRFDRCFSGLELRIGPGPLRDMDAGRLKVQIRKWAKAVVSYARQLSFGSPRSRPTTSPSSATTFQAAKSGLGGAREEPPT